MFIPFDELYKRDGRAGRDADGDGKLNEKGNQESGWGRAAAIAGGVAAIAGIAGLALARRRPMGLAQATARAAEKVKAAQRSTKAPVPVKAVQSSAKPAAAPAVSRPAVVRPQSLDEVRDSFFEIGKRNLGDADVDAFPGRNSTVLVASSDDVTVKNAIYAPLNGEMWVDFSEMKVEAGKQGGGAARSLLRDLVGYYDKSGINRIQITAEKVGAYAWLKFGFLPTEGSWEGLATSIGKRLDKDPDLASLPAAARARVKSILADPDPAASWQLADLYHDGESLGKKLLVGQNWHGKLDLNNATQRTRFETYVGAGTVKKFDGLSGLLLADEDDPFRVDIDRLDELVKADGRAGRDADGDGKLNEKAGKGRTILRQQGAIPKEALRIASPDVREVRHVADPQPNGMNNDRSGALGRKGLQPDMKVRPTLGNLGAKVPGKLRAIG
jgi:hypothetical protein